MTFKEFEKFAQNHNVVPVFERVTADLLTPVLAYLKIRNTGSNHFLLESVEGIGRLARYSFIGKNPRKVFYNRNKNLTIVENGQKTKLEKDIFEFISEEISKFNQPKINDLPDFSGGIVGYLGYENIGLIENVIKFTDNCQLDTPDSFFGIYNTLIIFDHYKHQLIILTNVLIDKNKGLRTLYDEAKEKLKKIREEIDGP
ncbi:MAG: anthranilate synthase component I, partial [Ignavibacteriaceae bacterium]